MFFFFSLGEEYVFLNVLLTIGCDSTQYDRGFVSHTYLILIDVHDMSRKAYTSLQFLSFNSSKVKNGCQVAKEHVADPLMK